MCTVNRWAGRVLAEFFQQGDTERASGVAISPMMDRTTTSPAMSQINFTEFIVAPLFHQVLQNAMLHIKRAMTENVALEGF